MYQQISHALKTNCSKIAYVYHKNEDVYFRTYNNIKEEIDQINHLFDNIPTGVVIAVQLGKKPCLLPVIYCLLQYKIAFLLLDEHNTTETCTKENLVFYALITCHAHGKKHNNFPHNNFKKSFVQVTNLGCSFTFNIFRLNTIEEEEKSVKFKDICYIITTSGTLGEAKLVKVPENSIFNNIKSFIQLFEVNCTDVIYFGTPLTFDPCIVEILLALSMGACLVATSTFIRNNPRRLLKTLFRQDKTACINVTFMQMCPSVFLQFSTEQMQFIFYESGLKILALGGEEFPAHILPEQSLKTCKMYNLYGITEVSCWASVERVFHGDEVAIGTPLRGIVFRIETSEGSVPLWEDCQSGASYEGILHIGSKTRICYLDDEEANIPCDDYVFRSSGDVVKVVNGKVFYISRSNGLIKRFGQRISLRKMEDLIFSSTQIFNKCIRHRGYIICFLKIPESAEYNENQEIKRKTIDKIRAKLVKSIAAEFVPDFFDALSNFPTLSHNGKLDVKALQSLADVFLHESAKKQQSIESISEKKVFQELWFKHTGVKGDHDDTKFFKWNFWESGGTSIAAMQLAREYEHATNVGFNRSVLDLQLQEALDFVTLQNARRTQNSTHIKIIWKADMKACIDSPPSICDINGRSYVAVGNFAQIFSVFDAESGREIASIDFPNVIESASLASNDYFFVPCFDGQLHCLRLQLTASHTSEEVCGKLKRIWTFPTGDRLKSKPVAINEHLIFGSYDGYLYAITKNGNLEWKANLREPICTEVRYSNEKLFVSTLKGTILGLSSKHGQVLWMYKTKSPIFACSELSMQNDCVLFLDIEGNIFCFSITNDLHLWTFDSSAVTYSMKTFGSITLFGNRIFLGTKNGYVNVFVFNERECNFAQTVPLQATLSSITSKPLYRMLSSKHYLLVVNRIGCIQLLAIDDDARAMGAYFLPNECFSSPQGCNRYANRFYLGCRDNNLYCIEIVV